MFEIKSVVGYTRLLLRLHSFWCIFMFFFEIKAMFTFKNLFEAPEVLYSLVKINSVYTC